MIDWHCHILPGIDDGPTEIEQSVVMADMLAKAGFAEVYCTPHMMRGCFDEGNDVVLRRIGQLQEQLDREEIVLKLRPGREYFLDEYFPEYLEDPLPLGDSRMILVEISPHISADMVRQFLYDVVRSGFTPVIAHPERSRLLEPTFLPVAGSGLLGRFKSLISGINRDRKIPDSFSATWNPLHEYLCNLGCSFQGNLGSFSGCYGRQVKAVAEAFRERGVYDRYGSDLHTAEQAHRILHTSQQS
jgi:protein-tyrosine phosphatase